MCNLNYRREATVKRAGEDRQKRVRPLQGQQGPIGKMVVAQQAGGRGSCHAARGEYNIAALPEKSDEMPGKPEAAEKDVQE